MAFRARFRFRLRTRLNLQSRDHTFAVSGREVRLSAVPDDVPINESEWLVMNATGFATEDEARKFANKLRAAAEIASVASRLGIDAGIDRRTSGVGQLVRERAAEVGILLRDNVHGVDVFEDHPHVRIVNVTGTGSTLTSPEPFLLDVCMFYDTAHAGSQKTKDIVLLLNYALMRPEPVAQIVFCISAVEMLGQLEHWSAAQQELLEHLAVLAPTVALPGASAATPDERQEVQEAIRRSTHKLGLRQGVLRLLADIGREDLKARWDEIYTERSKLVHGLAPKPGIDYGPLAYQAISLCGEILLTVIAREVTNADQHLRTYYR